MRKNTKRIGEILVERGLITEAQLHDALLEQKTTDGFLGGILMKRGLVNDKNITEALSEQFSLPIVDLKNQYIDFELARKFSSSLIVDHKCFPLSKADDIIMVGIVNPLNAVAMTKIEEEAKPFNVKFVLVSDDQLKEVIQQYRQSISQSIRNLLRRDKKPE